MNALLTYLRRQRPDGAPVEPDGDLLSRYLAGADEAAFVELVRRHGPTVYGVCRRWLQNPADADDAFQAVWLVLVRRAARLTGRSTLGPWLYQVAVWTARNLRRRNAHRLARSQPLPEFVPADAASEVDRLDLDAALLSLPEKYRAPVILCHLHGWSRRDAAAHLGCPEGTLSALLARALARLRKRFAGADPVPLLAAGGVALSASTVTAAARGAAAFRTASLAAAGVSPAVADLTRGVLRMFWVKKLTAGCLTVTAIAATGLGIGLGTGTGPQAFAQTATPPNAKAGGPNLDELQTRIKQLEADLQKLKAQDAKDRQKEAVNFTYVLQNKQAAAGPRLEVVARSAPDAGIEIREYGADGKSVGSVRCSGLEVARRVLARTHKDPDGPKSLTIQADPGYPAADMVKLVEACKTAGYASANVSKAVTLDTVVATPAADITLAPSGAAKRAAVVVREVDGKKVVQQLRLDGDAMVVDALDVVRLQGEKLDASDVVVLRADGEQTGRLVLQLVKPAASKDQPAVRLQSGDEIHIVPSGTDPNAVRLTTRPAPAKPAKLAVLAKPTAPAKPTPRAKPADPVMP